MRCTIVRRKDLAAVFAWDQSWSDARRSLPPQQDMGNIDIYDTYADVCLDPFGSHVHQTDAFVRALGSHPAAIPWRAASAAAGRSNG